MKVLPLILAAALVIFSSSATIQAEAKCLKTHVVGKRETCSSIRKKYGLSAASFKALNPGVSCSPLKIQSKVCVKGTSSKTTKGCKSYYEVVSGDTCDQIASKNNESLATLLADNPTANCNNVQIGDAYCIGYGKGNLKRIPIPSQKCTVGGAFALTFDDGPYQYTDSLLDFLKENKLQSTFFVNGQNFGNIYNYSSTLKRIFKEGHQLCHHTWSHADITTLTEAELHLEISKLNTAFRDIIGVIPTCFRPPYGNTNLASLKVLNELDYFVVKWDVTNQDAVTPNVTLEEAQATFNQTLALAGIHPPKDGHIGLEHDPIRVTVRQFAPWVFKYVKSLGYKTMTVGDCMGLTDRTKWYRK